MAWPNVLLLLAVLAGRTAVSPPYPRPGTTPVFENDAIAVWDVSWLKQKYPLHTHRYDLIGVSYVEGDRIITQGEPRAALQHQGLGVSVERRRQHPRRGRRERSADARDSDGGEDAGAGADVVEPPTACTRSSAPRRGRTSGRTPGRFRPGTAAPRHRHVKNAVELIFDASTPARTPKADFVPAGTVHDGPRRSPAAVCSSSRSSKARRAR